jgi:hypothetical protein
MDSHRDGRLTWRRSAGCDSSTCVEVAIGDEVGVRDGKHPTGPVLWFTHDEWAAFVAGVRAGDFD